MPRPKMPAYDSSSDDDLECTCYDLQILSDSDSDFDIPLKQAKSRSTSKPARNQRTRSTVGSARKTDRVSELYDRMNAVQEQRVKDHQQFKVKSAKTRSLIDELMSQLRESQGLIDRKDKLNEKLSAELNTTSEMESIVRDQEKLLLKKQKELNLLKRQLQAAAEDKEDEMNTSQIIKDRYEREKLRRRVLEEDRAAAAEEERRAKESLEKELEVSRDLESLYKRELDRTRDALNTSEIMLEASQVLEEKQRQRELELERLRLRNMQDDVYRITHAYQLEHLLNQAQDKLIGLRPYLGVCFVNGGSKHGTMLQQVRVGHAGYACGLRSGDVVMSINGQTTRTKTEFYSALFGLAPGDGFSCTIFRQTEGYTRTLAVTMGSHKLKLQMVLALKRIVDKTNVPNSKQFDLDVKEAGLNRLKPGAKPSKRRKTKKMKSRKAQAWSKGQSDVL